MTELKRCACGCGKLVKSKRSNAIYATSNCRVKALRKRERQADIMQSLPDEWHEVFSGLGKRYGVDAIPMLAAIVEFTRNNGKNASIDMLNIVGQAIRIEGKHNA